MERGKIFFFHLLIALAAARVRSSKRAFLLPPSRAKYLMGIMKTVMARCYSGYVEKT